MTTLINTLDFCKVFLLFVCGISFISCGNSKSIADTKNMIDDSSEIIFLTYSISKTASEKRTVKLVSQKTVEGQLKNNSQNNIANIKNADIIVRQLDENSKVIYQKVIGDPLRKEIEYVNESKQLAIKTVNLNETEFSIRMALQKRCATITLNDLRNSKPIVTTKIE